MAPPITTYGYLTFSVLSFCFLGTLYYYWRPRALTFVALTRKPNFRPDYSVEKADFDAKGTGVMVFLHIQKTGGSEFGRHLLHLDVGKPCKITKPKNGSKHTPKNSKCYRPGQSSKQKKGKVQETWLFSRFTTGWPCGVHADWTELHECVARVLEYREGHKHKEREFFYVTMLREPVSRFVSEYAHVKRGATWVSARHCNNREVPKKYLRDCYPGFSQGKRWPSLTLVKFLTCPFNLGINRQTRMLADLTLVNCYNTDSYSREERDKRILESAITNLKSLPYFGLTEYQVWSKELFEHTFDLKFTEPFDSVHEQNVSKSQETLTSLQDSEINWIKEVNHLDVKLYDIAKKVFLDRVDRMRRNVSYFHHQYWSRYLVIDGNSELES
ncbi:heparan-sulfate 6-O-sulfotransferase 1-B-like [Corticium candelabrum]|uniref:heparan-sulfate 6-O-sulfotransferase 1-B-like n=1 Tax=Corticium candelabrum TaxID=121492 RepID=UPI002E273305|nr:heparan-sulfate 6-O-sulfotransferase 1-B-like [Corticium candelabrum]XP_062501863.1 heparan-sulfate 6-O-sulfotransferase 1-B-like [Corticium candelabrum]